MASEQSIISDPLLANFPKVKTLLVKSGQYKSILHLAQDVIANGVLTIDIKDYTNDNGVPFDRLTIDRSKGQATLYHSGRSDGGGTFEGGQPLLLLRDVIDFNENWFYCQKCKEVKYDFSHKYIYCEKCQSTSSCILL